MKSIDLHTHTTASDGTLTPSELIDYAVSKGLKAIAITDHDNIDGISEAMSRAEYHRSQGVDIEVIPGIEFSTGYMGSDVHIVGLYVDYKGEYLKTRLSNFIKGREKRNIEMCERLSDRGMSVTMEDLRSAYPNCVITRAHFARYLYEQGYISSIKEGFERYIGDGKPCFVSRKKTTPMRAVEIIRHSGGFPILAHPVLYGFSKDKLEHLLSELKEAGLRGIEAIYSTYKPSDERDIRALASKYNLCISGGSDFHGSNKPDIDLGTGMGHLFVPEDVLSEIKLSHAEMLKDNDSYQLPKILFSDLDGTLLPSSKIISPYTFNVLKEWTNSGHYLALCSGRDISSVNQVYHENRLNQLQNVYTIGYNGGLIFDPVKNETLYKTALTLKDAEYLADAARKAGIYMQTYADDYFVIPYEGDESRYYTKVIKTKYVISENVTDKLTDGPCKCLFIELNDIEKLQKFKEEITPWANEHDISLMYSNPNYLEVIPSNSGKGAAVKILKDILNIKGLMTIAAGDEENDISMLKAADAAIAMSPARDSVKNEATIISEDDCDHDGLALTLKRFMR